MNGVPCEGRPRPDLLQKQGGARGPTPHNDRMIGNRITHRTADGVRIPGTWRHAFIRNGGTFYLTDLVIYADGLIDYWGLATIDEFVHDRRPGAVGHPSAVLQRAVGRRRGARAVAAGGGGAGERWRRLFDQPVRWRTAEHAGDEPPRTPETFTNRSGPSANAQYSLVSAITTHDVCLIK